MNAHGLYVMPPKSVIKVFAVKQILKPIAILILYNLLLSLLDNMT